ncbi:MAG: tripartite tricarboxylate transporter TctB family protein [Rhodoplanes sp.]|uniref:tripartite tricarboxylate transporter TctB family protein n=1 Tax=Rhodoplanes sp. TaxID=1968906 RepID=UPI0017E07364|nr:tripartite tricarboxylate transporter TctB family protein [Rhodoplanes sp.]NVO16293.1 tripartite tricarboxylate transporter TctB family protein [Rhodoplanes sp.]
MISRFTAELATAVGTATFGAVVLGGAVEYGIGWDSAGPEPGAFPFYIGAMIVVASGVNAARTVMQRPLAGRVFLDRARFSRIASFFGLAAAFVLLSVYLGLYVATVLYLSAAIWWQGRYRPWVGAVCGITASLFFYFVLEKGFQVPLLKGPIEAMLGIY